MEACDKRRVIITQFCGKGAAAKKRETPGGVSRFYGSPGLGGILIK
jgi:hypothetical protein